MELTAKGRARLDKLLDAWRWAVVDRRLRRVVYRCPPRIRPIVKRGVERVKAEAAVVVEEL